MVAVNVAKAERANFCHTLEAKVKKIIRKVTAGPNSREDGIGSVWEHKGASPPQEGFAMANLFFLAALAKSCSKAPSRSVLVKR